MVLPIGILCIWWLRQATFGWRLLGFLGFFLGKAVFSEFFEFFFNIIAAIRGAVGMCIYSEGLVRVKSIGAIIRAWGGLSKKI